MNEYYPHFSQAELESKDTRLNRVPGTGEHHMDPDFMLIIELIREDYDKPMKVSSAYRTPDYNEKVSSTGLTGPHTTGQAIDIVVSGTDALHLIHVALDSGIVGIGVSQKGPHGKRFIHLDNLPDAPGQPRPWLWSYS